MSVIAWDGKSLAADRQCTTADLRALVSKIRRLSDGTVLAWTGKHEMGLALARWYEEGADRAKWPKFQEDKEDWCRLIVATNSGRVIFYEQLPEPQEVLDTFMAWGSGRDFAIGAMGMGADARTAVEIASRFSVGCGYGVDVFELIHSVTTIDFRAAAD